MAIDFSKYGTPLQGKKPTPTGGIDFSKYGTPISQQTPQEPQRSTLGKVAHFLAPTITESVEKAKQGEELGARDYLGSALEAGSFLFPAGKIAKGVGLAAKGTGTVAKFLAKPLARQVVESAGLGAVTGGLAESGRAVGEGAGAGDIAMRTAIGGATGGAFGAAIPPVVRGAQKVLGKGRELIQNAVPSKLVEGGKIFTKEAKEVVRQGIPESEVSLIEGSSSKDKVKMSKMLDIRLSQRKNARITDRASDVAGNTFVENIVKPLQNSNKIASQKLDVVASGLSGKKVDSLSAFSQFVSDLESSGIKIRKNGILNFKGSDFEGIGGAKSAIQNVFNRARRVVKTGDALQLHRTKRYVDEIVNYGKSVEGLSGRAQKILKSFRHNADSLLDAHFPAYNKANVAYAETIGELDKIAQAMGKNFKVGQSFADAKAGVTLRRLFSNTQSRSQLLQILESAQNVAKKHGVKIDEDIISQAKFADTLERILGSEAPTSMQGIGEKVLDRANDAVSIGSDVLRGNIFGAVAKTGKKVYESTRGINEENLIKSLRDILSSNKKTVFGKVK